MNKILPLLKPIMKTIIEELKKRTYYLSYNISCISNKSKWESVEAIGRMDVYKEEYGKITNTKNYYILSNKSDLYIFINITREHWNIEYSLHWRLDVIMNEDHSTSKKDNDMENLSILRKIVFILARLDTSMGNNLSLKRKMTHYLLDFYNIENLIFNVIPSL